MKPLIWLGDSRTVVRSFQDEARQEAGHELNRVQNGRQPIDFKSMPVIGTGVQEIRIHNEQEYRVIYVAKFTEAIYVLHAFVKKTRRTSKQDIDLAAARYRALLNERKSR